MAALAAGSELAETGIADGPGCRGATAEASLIEGSHPGTRTFIGDRPQAHDEVTGAGDLEGATETEDTFAGANLAVAGIAAGKNDEFRAAEIERGNFFRGEDAIVLEGSRRSATIGAGEGQPGTQKGILEIHLGSATSAKEESVGGNVDDAFTRGHFLEGRFRGAFTGKDCAGVALGAPDLEYRLSLQRRAWKISEIERGKILAVGTRTAEEVS